MKVIVIGATGLVGREIVKRLLRLNEVSEVRIFVRRSKKFTHPKLIEEIVNFEHFSSWKDKIRGDVLFSALGTTLKNAGSKEAQYRIDYDYQYMVAEAAAQNGVASYVLISSVGADPRSKIFYLRMKGELDEKVRNLPFHSISILRPGPLMGHRESPRLSEMISTHLLKAIPPVLLPARVTPVNGERVAEVAVNMGIKAKVGVSILGPSDILP